MPQCGDFRLGFIFMPYKALILVMYFGYALFACMFSARSLLRKGMNQEMRKMIINRQLVYLLILALTGVPWFYYQSVDYVKAFNNISGYFGDKNDIDDEFVSYIYDIEF